MAMKLCREFRDEQQARTRERALQAMGYRAWVNQREGIWCVFWFEPFN
jgi:hypothetical protein